MVKIKNYSDECGILMQGFRDRGETLPITRWRLYFKLYPSDADKVERVLRDANMSIEFDHINPLDISYCSIRYLIKIINRYDENYDIKLSVYKDRIKVTHYEPKLDDSLTYLKSLPILNPNDNDEWLAKTKDDEAYMEFIVDSRDLLNEYKKSMEMR